MNGGDVIMFNIKLFANLLTVLSLELVRRGLSKQDLINMFTSNGFKLKSAEDVVSKVFKKVEEECSYE